MILLFAALLAGTGCAGPDWVTLRPTPSNPLAGPLQLLAPGGPRPTDRTMQLLRRYDLAGELGGNRRELIGRMHDILAQHPKPDPEIVYAIAELAYLGAKKTEMLDRRAALDLYGTSVMHAYSFLFDDDFGIAGNPYDPLFRGTCDLYNAALEGTLRIARDDGNLQPGQSCTIQTAGRYVDIQIVLRGESWHSEDFQQFEFVSDYEVHGLRNHYHTYGLGVPLIAVRRNQTAHNSAEQFYPPNLSFPATAFLRMAPQTTVTELSGQAPMQVQLELYDPLAASALEVRQRRVPLESDLSTPLAYFLNQPEFDDSQLSTAGLLYPEQVQHLTGLYMLAPYRPEKIPVVMVHGLWSSPVTWMEMFNDLHSDPEIRKHFQFWFYLYPTGQPFWFSAAQMREDMKHVRDVLDPGREEPALDQIVLVGHSMGGLVSKLQTVNSGEDFWRIVSDQPLEVLRAEPAVRDTLARTLYFQPNTSVRRVVTIGTPHRGSDFANETTRWLGQKFIQVPSRMLQRRQRMLLENPGFFREDALLSIDTSIDSLASDSPFLPVLLSAQAAPWMAYHNIVGRVEPGGILTRLAGDGDGVVSLASAKLDPETIDSQLVVPADHSNVHRHPQAILEVRRILFEHLDRLRNLPRRFPPTDRAASRIAPQEAIEPRPPASDPSTAILN